ncbi:sigma-70 family RNA polymerase sigma factor [Pseudoxanthomonas sp. PXM02]|uniref:RNA polymerase sigma factor n=1 Tax=Pseudoxanthomonas sp. PXM02 TaxID=2769294 RepID=UPI001784228D|nr:sigma-70 family RNA polymerase sigma factor [Pseudoxanthomonas sp. PXM02]MBD9478038.1 sigma-70 family RNA polymerase sigma factor [Pseudoxanthomonas sp. PXM02]
MDALAIELSLRDALPAAARGDQAAYGRVVALCQNAVTGIALAITRDVQASEDIAQEAFLKGWRQLATLKNPDSFLPWLREITRNLARDHLRAQRRRPMTGASAEIAVTLAADTAPTPVEMLLQTEQEALAREVIAALPEDSREVLLLYYREGQRSQQVASLLGITDAAVRKRLSRARHYVREELMVRFGEFARTSAPSAAFASGILGLLAIAAPPSAGAVVLGTGGALAGKGLLKLVGGALGATAFGTLVGVGAVWFGIRKYLRDPLDARERDELLRYGAVNTFAIFAFIAGISALARIPGWIPHTALTLGYMTVICWTSGRWLPRILERRQARDLARDPDGVRRCMERQRFWRRWGLALAVTLATAGLLAGLVMSGRLVL